MSTEFQALKINRSSILNNYEISQEKLGVGLNGTVSVCYRKSDHKKFALKMLDSKNPKSRREIDLQWKACQNSDFIVKIVEVYENHNQNSKRDHFLIIMECMEGGELFKRIQDNVKPFTEKEAARLVRNIALAIKHLHDLNIAHRDLKPENLLFLTKEENSILKLSDFGFANTCTSKILKTPCYTPYYAAPEVIDTSIMYDINCDLWSLGVIAYILLCGYPPFYSHNGQNMSPGMSHRIKYGDYKYPKKEWGSISSDAKDLINSLLKTAPEERININQVVTHKWISQYMEVPPTPLETCQMLKDQHQGWDHLTDAMNFTLRTMREQAEPGMVLKKIEFANNAILKKRQHRSSKIAEKVPEEPEELPKEVQSEEAAGAEETQRAGGGGEGDAQPPPDC